MANERDQQILELQRQVNQLLGQQGGHANGTAPPAAELREGAQEQLDLGEGFEVFTGRYRRATSNVPRVSLQRQGNLALNNAAFKALGDPKAAVFAYNPTTREIAIKAAPLSLGYASPVRKHSRQDSFTVSAGSFAKSIGLNFADGIHVFDDIQVREGMMILPLDKARKVPGRKGLTGSAGGESQSGD